MSCNSNCYLPIPPRAWSRVQNNCSLIDNIQGDNQVQVPYSKKLVPNSVLYLEYAMLNKGNVLQYKKNSSNLTKKQRYSQIAKGLWTNRNTTWATQSTRGYTNPNNQSLLRVGSINITLAGIPTAAPVTCPTNKNIINDTLPPGGSGGSGNPETLPPPPPPPSGNTGTALPPTADEPPIQPIVIQDLGNLVCGTQENVCTGELISQPTDIICHPTTDSDVPGQIMELCWNDGTPTWYPRQRYVMSNSGNKWPVNATLLSAVNILAPVITSITNVDNVVTLEWTLDERCIPADAFTIYENGIPVKIVSGSTFITSITVDNSATYIFYIIGTNANVVSDPSNSVSIDIYILLIPAITTEFSPCPVQDLAFSKVLDTCITLTWSDPSSICTISYYELYQVGTGLIYTVSYGSSIYSHEVTGLSPTTVYSFYIISVGYTTLTKSTKISTTISTTTLSNAPTITMFTTLNCSSGTYLEWIAPTNTYSTVASYNIYNNFISPITGITDTFYTISGDDLICGQNTFYVKAFFTNSTLSLQSNTVTTEFSPCPVQDLAFSKVLDTCITLTWSEPSSICHILAYDLYQVGTGLIYTVSSGSLSYSHEVFGLTSDAPYSFYIVSIGDTTLTQSATISAITLSNAPTITMFTTLNCSSGTYLEWIAPTNTYSTVVSYNIYNNFISPITGVTDTFYTISGDDLICGQNTFYVKAFFTNSTLSLQSNTETIELKPCSPSITPGTTTSTSVIINWTLPSTKCHIISYNIYQDNALLSNTSGLSYTAGSLITGQPYTFYVTSVGANAEESDPSNILSVTTEYTTPIITAITYCYKEATISWTNVDTPNYYEIYQDNIALSPTTSNLSYTVSNLTNGQSYNFYIKAVYSGSEKNSSTYTSTLPLTSSYFTVNPNIIPSDNGTNTVYTFTTPTTYTFSKINSCTDIITANVLLVGGGGGGGGGHTLNGDLAGGAGGGGGGIIQVSRDITSNNLILLVGQGGSGGNGGTNQGGDTDGLAGSNTTLNDNFGSVTSFGGGYGAHGANNTSTPGGIGGNGNGGNGGNGGSNIQNGSNSTFNNPPTYSGGGGGGGYPYGGAGGNGYGGASANNGGNIPYVYGGNGIAYGSGGGGGGYYPITGATGGKGGNGANGLIQITFPN